MRRKYLIVPVVAVLPCLLFMLMAGKQGSSHFEEAKEAILMRKIGHELLLQTGDSTSRVLPVRKVSDNEYHIPFEKTFTFEPDSLSAVVSRVIASQSINRDYIVEVKECTKEEVVFGYAMQNSGRNDITACRGRKLPRDCYYISLSFNEPASQGWQASLPFALSGLLAAGLAFYGLKLFRKRKLPVEPVAEAAPVPEAPAPTPTVDTSVAIGGYQFSKEAQSLAWNGETIPLTGKESKLLSIFAQSINEVVEKARLQKEVWEDEGVIVGRSLDMFVSKLRKKLEKDPAVKLVNIHSRGYKLEVSATAQV